MKIRLILLIALTLLSYQRSISAQIHKHLIDVKKNTINDSVFNNVQKNEFEELSKDILSKKGTAYFDIHFAWALTAGARIGVRVYDKSLFSYELAYGFDGRALFFGWGECYLIKGGINYHLEILENFTVSPSLLMLFNNSGLEKVKDILIGIDFGYLKFRAKELNFFIRSGAYISTNMDDNKSIKLFPNIDMGMNLGF